MQSQPTSFDQRPRASEPPPPRARYNAGEHSVNAAAAMGRVAFQKASEADAFLKQLAHSLSQEEFRPEQTRLPDGRSFADLGWDKTHAEAMLSAAFDRHAELSRQERREASTVQTAKHAESDLDRSFAISTTDTAETDRRHAHIQDLQNQLLVAQQHLREFQDTQKTQQEGAVNQLKSFFTKIWYPDSERETLQQSQELQARIREIQNEIRAAREGSKTSIQSKRRAHLRTTVENRRQAEEDTDRRIRAMDELEEIEREIRTQQAPQRKIDAAEEWEKWKQDLQEERAARRSAPPTPKPDRSEERHALEESGVIYSPKQLGKNLLRDATNAGIMPYVPDTDTIERESRRRSEEEDILLAPEEFTSPEELDILMHPGLDLHKLHEPTLQKLSHDEMEDIEFILKKHGVNAANEWQRVNAVVRVNPNTARTPENRREPTENEVNLFAYNVANAYLLNLAKTFTSDRKLKAAAERNLVKLEELFSPNRRTARRPISYRTPRAEG